MPFSLERLWENKGNSTIAGRDQYRTQQHRLNKPLSFHIMNKWIMNTFSSAVLFKKHTKASENWFPHGPLLKSAMHGQSKAFWAFESRDWKSNIRSLVIYLKEEVRVRENQPHFHHRHMLQLLKNKTIKSSDKPVNEKGWLHSIMTRILYYVWCSYKELAPPHCKHSHILAFKLLRWGLELVACRRVQKHILLKSISPKTSFITYMSQ